MNPPDDWGPPLDPSGHYSFSKTVHTDADFLSSWPVASGVSWIQTREPCFARKLTKRSDARLVAVGVAGGFLRIFEMRRYPAFMRRLIARYMAANERFREPCGAQRNVKRRSGLRVAEAS